MEAYDAVVIGAGNGGLTGASALAQAGLKVLLLERHNVPGGCATSFCRGRFEFEVALHQLSGLGRPDRPGPLRSVFQRLGVLDDLTFVEIPELYRVVMPGAFDLTLPSDRAELIEVLGDRFPAEKAGVARFFDLLYRFAGEVFGAHYFSDPTVTREKYPLLFEYAFRSAADVLDEYFTDPLLKAVLSVYWGYIGVPPGHMAFAWLAILFLAYLEFKPFHLQGGSQALSNALLSRFQALGGTARMNCGAARIELKDGVVAAVVLEDGERVAARYILSNASPVTVFGQLIGPDQAPAGVFQALKRMEVGHSGFVIFIGLDCEPADIGLATSTNFLLSHTDLRDRPLREMRELKSGTELKVLSCHDIADPTFSPPGACQLGLVTLKHAEPWLSVPPTQYFRVKHACAQAMLDQAAQICPGLKDHIEEIEVATPLTHMRYLGHPAGSIYGFTRFLKDGPFTAPSPPGQVKGLYFAGGWAGDHGFQGTLGSGVSGANAIISDLRA